VVGKISSRRSVRYIDIKTLWPDAEESDDVTDWVERAGGTVEKLLGFVETLPRWEGTNGTPPPWLETTEERRGDGHDRGETSTLSSDARLKKLFDASVWLKKLFDAAALQTMTFPPLKYVLPGYVPEGATLLVSRPAATQRAETCISHSAGRRADMIDCPPWRLSWSKFKSP
jgi:hypothetical protein